MAKIAVRGVTKLFGSRESDALILLRGGLDKQEILARTGCSLALNDVSLEIAEGEIFVLMGLSGSGKSTLVRHINRLIDPSSGAILVDGKDVTGLTLDDLRQFRRRAVSMVFQGYALMPHWTVRQNVAFGLIARGESKGGALNKAQNWIAAVGLDGYEDAYPAQLSGGMRQRVGIARALAVDTSILLMDEPFSALDPLTRADMQSLLLDLQRRLHKTILFVTHDIDEAIRIGDRIAVMKDGGVIQVGTPSQIIERPADGTVSRFVQSRSPLLS